MSVTHEQHLEAEHVAQEIADARRRDHDALRDEHRRARAVLEELCPVKGELSLGDHIWLALDAAREHERERTIATTLEIVTAVKKPQKGTRR